MSVCKYPIPIWNLHSWTVFLSEGPFTPRESESEIIKEDKNAFKCQAHPKAEWMSWPRPLALIFTLRSLRTTFNIRLPLVSVITCNLDRSQDASHSDMFMLNKQASEGIIRVISYPSPQDTKHQKKVSLSLLLSVWLDFFVNILLKVCSELVNLLNFHIRKLIGQLLFSLSGGFRICQRGAQFQLRSGVKFVHVDPLPSLIISQVVERGINFSWALAWVPTSLGCCLLSCQLQQPTAFNKAPSLRTQRQIDTHTHT